MRQHITIKDIARIAGVSTSTVSRALSNSPELSEQTRQRILISLQPPDFLTELNPNLHNC